MTADSAAKLPEGESIFLVGMMGAGKTTVGRALAQRLGWPFLDSDAQVEAATGMTVPEIFSARGEEAFRAEESTVLSEACHRSSPAVVAVAGGAVLDAGNRALLARSGLVIWLRAKLDTLIRRVGDGSGRPLLGRDPALVLARLEIERRPFYAEVAGVVIDVDEVSKDEAVSAAADAWAAYASDRHRVTRARL